MTVTEPKKSPPTNRDAANWAQPVDRLSAAGVAGAKDDAVTGKRVSGPLQGFGQLWQKTFTVRLDGADVLRPAIGKAAWQFRLKAVRLLGCHRMSSLGDGSY